MNSFEQRLWRDLLSAHGARLAALPSDTEPYRRRRSRLVRAFAIGLTALVVAVLLALPQSSTPPPAYAVTDNHNGTVTLTIRQFLNRAAINRALLRTGVRARVVPLQRSCRTALNMASRYLEPDTQPWSAFPTVRGPVGSWTVGIIPRRIPIGHTLVVALRQTTGGWDMADAIVAGEGPACSSPEYLQGLRRAPST